MTDDEMQALRERNEARAAAAKAAMGTSHIAHLASTKTWHRGPQVLPLAGAGRQPEGTARAQMEAQRAGAAQAQ
jgi:hypothetical protein